MRALHPAAIAGVVVATIAVVALPSVARSQQKFPTKPIRLVIPNAPGGFPDVPARMVAQKMSERWKQPVVVDNRVGAVGTLAAAHVAKATPDGHTLLWASSTFVSSAALQPKLPYDPLNDFAGISRTGFGIIVLVVAPALGVKSMKDFIALAKAQPGKIVFASPPVGTASYLTGVRFNLAAGVKVVTVAFKSGPEAILQTLGGRTHYAAATPTAALPFIQEGKLLALAVNSPQRSPILPDVPAIAETLPEFKRPEASGGLLAPAGTPRPILNQISKEFARILALPDIREKFDGWGFVPAPTTPEEFDRILREQIEIMSKLVRDAGLVAK